MSLQMSYQVCANDSGLILLPSANLYPDVRGNVHKPSG